jgi:hypothetical protein
MPCSLKVKVMSFRRLGFDLTWLTDRITINTGDSSKNNAETASTKGEYTSKLIVLK